MQFFEDRYEEKETIEERLLAIEDLQVRKEAKELLTKVMQPFYEDMQNIYRKLDERLGKERNQAENYEIITAIKLRKDVDLTDDFLHPMRKQDMEERIILMEDVLESLKAGEGLELYQVFVKDTYEKVLELLDIKQYFPVTIRTDYGTYRGKAELRGVKEYEEILLQLYEDFVCNGVEWKTINAPYLHKLLKVVLIEADCPEDEEIAEIQVDFGNYQDILKHDYVPLWNVSQISMQTSAYPVEKQDGICMEHTIHDTRLRRNCSYLVCEAEKVWDTELNIETGDLRIICEEPRPREWILWQIAAETSAKEKHKEWMRNGNVVKRPYIRTQAEAVRFAAGLPVGEYVVLQGVTTELPENGKEIKTYQMDAFLPEEIRKRADAPKLYLECMIKKQEDYLNQDMLSYLASRMQLIYPEYQCVVCVRT